MSNSLSFTVVLKDPYMYDTIKTISAKEFGGNDSACLRYLISNILGPSEDWAELYGPIQRIKSATREEDSL